MKTRADQIEERFKLFHEANPQVWELFKKFTFEAIAAGLAHYSSDAVAQRIRWHTTVETKPVAEGDSTKINDHYRAYYARMFHREFPQHDGFFRNRVQPSQKRGAHAIDLAFHDTGRASEIFRFDHRGEV